MLNIKLDEAIAHHNSKCKEGKELTRILLGRKLMPLYSDGTINKTLSHWQNGKMVPTPAPEDLCAIAEETGCTVDQILGREEIKIQEPKRRRVVPENRKKRNQIKSNQ